MNSYPSLDYLYELKSTLQTFLPACLSETCSPKRENIIRKTYSDTYTFQIAAITCIGKIEVSHLLASNEVVVPHLAEEYAELNFILREIDKKLKPLKQFQEVEKQVTRLSNALELKNIQRYLFDDLNHIHLYIDNNFDVKESVGVYKAYKPSEGLLKQLSL